MSALPPRVTAELVASIPFTKGMRLHEGPAVSDGSTLTPLAADLTPAGSFPLPEKPSGRTSLIVTPGADLVVLPGRETLTAIDAEGVRWIFEHADWAIGDGSGSAVVTADGRHVWATVPGPCATPYGGDLWIVLDAETCRLLATTTLHDVTAAGSEHHLHPDGEHVAVSIGEGQDAAPLYWGRLDGDTIVHSLSGVDDVLVHISPVTGEYFTVAHYLEDAAVHRLGEDGNRLTFPGEWLVVRAGLDGLEWALDYSGGFIDADTLLVCLQDYEEGGYAHLLVDAVSGDVLGLAEYAESPEGAGYPQGDGTWLTVVDNRLCRWKSCG